MTSCASTNALSGLHLNTDWLENKVHPLALFSCQKCTANNEIPVAFMGGSSDYYGNQVAIFSLFRKKYAKTGTVNT